MTGEQVRQGAQRLYDQDPDYFLERVQESMMGESLPGVCLNPECGEEMEPVEGDAVGYRCEGCGMRTVCGWGELVVYVSHGKG